MNGVMWGVVVNAPDGTGYGTVQFGNATRLVYFDPLRFGADGGLPVPVGGDRVAVATGTPTWQALWPLGSGIPAGVAGGAWVTP